MSKAVLLLERHQLLVAQGQASIFTPMERLLSPSTVAVLLRDAGDVLAGGTLPERSAGECVFHKQLTYVLMTFNFALPQTK